MVRLFSAKTFEGMSQKRADAGSPGTAANALLVALIEKDPAKRMTVAQALGSDWIARSLTSLEKLYKRVVLDSKATNNTQK